MTPRIAYLDNHSIPLDELYARWRCSKCCGMYVFRSFMDVIVHGPPTCDCSGPMVLTDNILFAYASKYSPFTH